MAGFADWFDAGLDKVVDPDARTLFAIVRGLPPSAWPHPHQATRVLALADKNRVTGELRRRIEGAAEAPPPWAQNLLPALAARSMGVAHFNAIRMAAVRAVGDAFAARGICCVALKGFHLAHAVYGHPADRPFGDVDLVVRPQDRRVAETTLVALGFRRGLAESGEGACEAAFHREVGKGLRLDIDLHWRLVGPLSLVWQMNLDEDGIFRRSTPAFSGIHFPSPEDALLFASVNLVSHGFRPLGNILDFRELIRHCEPDKLVARAQASRTRAAVSVGLALSVALFGGTIPARVARDLALPWWQRTAFGRLLRCEELARPEVAEGPMARYLLKILAQEGRGMARTVAGLPLLVARRWVDVQREGRVRPASGDGGG